MIELIIVGIGGFIGSCLRFLLTKFTGSFSNNLPYGTLFSNVIAGILIGFIVGLERQSITFDPRTRLFMTTGFLGGLSTFSAFSVETVNLFQNGKILLAGGNIAFNLCLSLLGVVVGIFSARLLIK